MEGKKMSKWKLALDTAEAHVICARAILESLADDAEIGADLIASDHGNE